MELAPEPPVPDPGTPPSRLPPVPQVFGLLGVFFPEPLLFFFTDPDPDPDPEAEVDADPDPEDAEEDALPEDSLRVCTR